MRQSGVLQREILENKLKNIQSSKQALKIKKANIEKQLVELSEAEAKVENTLRNFGKKQPRKVKKLSEEELQSKEAPVLNEQDLHAEFENNFIIEEKSE